MLPCRAAGMASGLFVRGHATGAPVLDMSMRARSGGEMDEQGPSINLTFGIDSAGSDLEVCHKNSELEEPLIGCCLVIVSLQVLGAP